MTCPLFASSTETAEFTRSISTRALGKTIHFHAQTQSTNNLALEAARSDGAHGSVFAADAQTAGRGRRGRQWNCPPAMGLLFSVLIRPTTIPLEAGGWIPLVAGLACAEALASFSERLRGITIKWPNDIVLPCDAYPGWKKLGGILCESALPAMSSAGTNSDRGYAVIGIGINLNQTREMLPDTDKAPPTSILLESGNSVDRQAVLKRILECLEVHLDTLSDATKREVLKRAIEDTMRAWLSSIRITFRTPPFDAPQSVKHSGVFAGLDKFGRIRIQSDGVEMPFADIEIIEIS